MAEKQYYFQKLTPVSNADISIYEKAIDFVFDNVDIKNIAISGAYCSGKSSILESYKKKHKNHTFLHIFLAHFHPLETENNITEENVKESILEGKILNQLLHQIPTRKIPQTNFRVKKAINPVNLIFLTIFFSLFIGSIMFLLFWSRFYSFISTLHNNWVKDILLILFGPYAVIISVLICIFCSIFFIFLCIKAQKNKMLLRKISVNGSEIKLFEEQDDSYFDKYLNDALYLFENVEADVIVFEDMDRFDACRIFERLHEVNTLANNHLKKKNKKKYKPLRFFYLLRDDIFESKDRTKFFDFIIPIVPIVDGSNSYDQLVKHLKKGNILDKFEKSFLQSLSLYIDDMRILKNVYNEFIVYINILDTTELDWNKMMAMIVYKNLFPRDFSDLQLGKGFVYTLFRQKPNLISESIKIEEEKRANLLINIKNAESEILNDEQELDYVYAAKKSLLQKDPYFYNRLTQDAQKISDDYDREIRRRKQAVQDRSKEKLSQLKKELADTEKNIAQLQAKSLKELITRENIDRVFSACHTNEAGDSFDFKVIKRSDYFSLLKFLVRSGYIDETYQDYMTYFYDESISANDKVFLRRITDKRGADYTYALKEPKKVVESSVIRRIDFEQEEILNFDLLEYLLLHKNANHSAYLETLIEQLKRVNYFDFVSKFYDTGKANKQFVIILNEQWPEFFSLVLNNNAMTPDQIWKYSLDTLYFSDMGTITKVNSNECLTKFISQNPDYLAIETPNIEKLISGFLLLDVSFETINYSQANRELFDEVYHNNLYQINFENVSLMIKNKYGIECDSDIRHKNYTLVMSQEDSPLARYILENMHEYIDMILNNCEGKITDDENININLLNCNDISIDKKKQYIELMSTMINDIKQAIDPKLWSILINYNKVVFSIENVIEYFQKYGLDNVLIEYINDTSLEEEFTSVADNFGEEIAEKLFNAVAICNDITTDKYRKILNDLQFKLDIYKADNIDDEKMKVLISNDIIQMNEKNLKYIRKKFKQHLYLFIKTSLSKYFSIQTSELFRFEEALEIITWKIRDDQKVGLLSYTSKPISIVGKEYSDTVNEYLITNNLHSDDKQYIFEHYSQYGKKTRISILKLAIKNIREIVYNNMIIDDALRYKLIQSGEISRENKINLFTIAIKTIDEDVCKTYLDELELSELKGIFERSSGRRNYTKNEEVTMILNAFKSRGWIQKYNIDVRNNSKYVVRKNELTKIPVYKNEV